MPILILVIAIFLVAAGLNNRLPQLVGLLKEDISPSDGSSSFLLWGMALVLIGILGYIKEIKPFSNAFLVLIFAGILLTNQGKGSSGGFFEKLQQALQLKNTPNFTTAAEQGIAASNLGTTNAFNPFGLINQVPGLSFGATGLDLGKGTGNIFGGSPVG